MNFIPLEMQAEVCHIFRAKRRGNESIPVPRVGMGPETKTICDLEFVRVSIMSKESP